MQLFAQPKAVAAAAVVVLIFALIPGMPKQAFLTIALQVGRPPGSSPASGRGRGKAKEEEPAVRRRRRRPSWIRWTPSDWKWDTA